MNTMLRRLALVALAVFGGWGQAVSENVARPGAMISFYKMPQSGKLEPDSILLEASVDTQDVWSQGNLARCSDMAKYSRMYGIVVWEGFLNLPAKGTYVFSLTGRNTRRTTLSFWMGGKMLLKAGGRQKGNSGNFHISDVSVSYPVRFVLTPLSRRSGYHDAYTLTYWLQDKPLKKQVLTPAMMFHAE